MNTQLKIFNSYDLRMTRIGDNTVRMQFLSDVFEYNYLPYVLGGGERVRSVLEIGCNKGFMCFAIKRKFASADVMGVDLSPNDIEYAKANFKDIEFICDDVTNILGSKKFDLVISKDCMEHIPKDRQEEFVKGVYDSLNENGMAIIQVPNMDWMFANHERYMDFTHEIGYTRESLRDIFRIVFGEENVEIKAVNYIFPKTVRQKFIYRFLRPILLYLLKIIFTLVGEGAGDVWFANREIMAILRKKHETMEKKI